MAIIENRTELENSQGNLFDSVSVSYELFVLIYVGVLEQVSEQVSRISRAKILEAIRKVEEDREEVGILFCCVPEGKRPKVAMSIFKVDPMVRLVWVNLFIPIHGEARFKNETLLKLGFERNVLNGGSLKLSIPIEREIGESKIENWDERRGTGKFYYLK